MELHDSSDKPPEHESRYQAETGAELTPPSDGPHITPEANPDDYTFAVPGTGQDEPVQTDKPHTGPVSEGTEGHEAVETSPYQEVLLGAAGLTAAVDAATERLGLSPGDFSYFSGSSRHSFEPQDRTMRGEAALYAMQINPLGARLTSYTDHVTVHGGRTADLPYGRITAKISEPLPDGMTHQSGVAEMPKPYISRWLTVQDGVITVDTPTRVPSFDDGPHVIEGDGRDPRFRVITSFNTRTGDIIVQSGSLVTPGEGTGLIDKTIQTSGFDLPPDILARRVDTLNRTVRAAAAILERIANRGTGENLTLNIKE